MKKSENDNPIPRARRAVADLVLLGRLADAGDADAAEALGRSADRRTRPILEAAIGEIAKELRHVTTLNGRGEILDATPGPWQSAVADYLDGVANGGGDKPAAVSAWRSSGLGDRGLLEAGMALFDELEFHPGYAGRRWAKVCRLAIEAMDAVWPEESPRHLADWLGDGDEVSYLEAGEATTVTRQRLKTVCRQVAEVAGRWQALCFARHNTGRVLAKHDDWFRDDPQWLDDAADLAAEGHVLPLLADASPRVRGLWSDGPLTDGEAEEPAGDLIDLARELGLGDYERPPADRTRRGEIEGGTAKLRPPLVQVHTVLPARTINGLYHDDAILMRHFLSSYDLPQGWSAAMLPEARRALEEFVELRPDLFGHPTPLRLDDPDLKRRLWAIDRRHRHMVLRTRPDAGATGESEATLELLTGDEDVEANAALRELRTLREAVAVEPSRVLLVCGADDAGGAAGATLLAAGAEPRSTLNLDPPRPGFCATIDELRRAAGPVPHVQDLLSVLDLLPVGARVAVHVSRRLTAAVRTGRRAEWEPRREAS